jgi:3-hydroxyacyl-CoA dehydrogenase
VDVATALDRLPKVELHCHVEGTMRPQTVVDLANKNGIGLPTSDPVELYRYTSLDTFLEIFWLVQSTLGSREDWARLAYESILDGTATASPTGRRSSPRRGTWPPARTWPRSSPGWPRGCRRPRRRPAQRRC